jgi:predicted small secreted protein
MGMNKNMRMNKNDMKILALVALIASAILLVSCHTAEGFGKDVEETGETIQEEVVP